MARSCEFLEMYLNLNTEALLLQTESFDKLYYFSSSITNGDRKKARKHRPHWFLSPQASSLANRIIHAVFHGHDFLNWHAFEDWHFHLDADPEERIDTKYQEGDAGDQPDHHALGRIGGDVQYHVYSSRNADARE